MLNGQEGGRDKHPVVEATERFDGQGVQLCRDSVIMPDGWLRPIGAVKGLGMDSFQVESEGFGHGATVASSISRHRSKSKCRESWFLLVAFSRMAVRGRLGHGERCEIKKESGGGGAGAATLSDV